jgi:hypothetical protein
MRDARPRNDANRWRNRAAETRMLAEHMNDEVSKRMVQRIADDYQRLAVRSVASRVGGAKPDRHGGQDFNERDFRSSGPEERQGAQRAGRGHRSREETVAGGATRHCEESIASKMVKMISGPGTAEAPPESRCNHAVAQKAAVARIPACSCRPFGTAELRPPTACGNAVPDRRK